MGVTAKLDRDAFLDIVEHTLKEAAVFDNGYDIKSEDRSNKRILIYKVGKKEPYGSSVNYKICVALQDHKMEIFTGKEYDAYATSLTRPGMFHRRRYNRLEKQFKQVYFSLLNKEQTILEEKGRQSFFDALHQNNPELKEQADKILLGGEDE